MPRSLTIRTTRCLLPLAFLVVTGLAVLSTPAYAQGSSGSPPASPPTAKRSPWGLADLHIHNVGELNSGGLFMWGSVDGELFSDRAHTATDNFAQCDGNHNHHYSALEPRDPTLPCGTWKRLRGKCGVQVSGINRGPYGESSAFPATEPHRSHGQLGMTNRGLGAILNNEGINTDETDDSGKHILHGISSDPMVPHWAGWPTSDSFAHHQLWEGWLRLAHEGPPFAGYVDDQVAAGNAVSTDQDLASALATFRGDYQTSMRQQHDKGRVGLNAAIVSLVGGWSACVLTTTPQQRTELGNQLVFGMADPDPSAMPVRPWLIHPRIATSMDIAGGRTDVNAGAEGWEENWSRAVACDDRTALLRQYVALHVWAAANQDWVALVDTPAEMKTAIENGKLALLVGAESSDWLNGYHHWRDHAPASLGVGTWTRNDAKSALKTELELFHSDAQALIQSELGSTATPTRLTSIIMTHQLGNAFAGPAHITKNLQKSQAARILIGTRGSGRRKGRKVLRQAPDELTSEELWHYAERLDAAILSASSRAEPKRLAARAFTLRMGRAGKYTKVEGRPLENYNVYKGIHNMPASTIGLTEHGTALLEVQRDNPNMLVDLAHLSDDTLQDIADQTRSVPRAFHSHAIPRGIALVPREQNSDVDLVKDAGARLVGVRTADDPILPGEDVSIGRAGAYHCGGTLYNYRVMTEKLASKGIATALATDIGGYINMSGPVGTHFALPRSGGATAKPCIMQAVGTWSEVDQRGMAHIGLATQAVVAAAGSHGTNATAGRSAKPAPELSQQLDSAAKLYEVWSGTTLPAVSTTPTTDNSRALWRGRNEIEVSTTFQDDKGLVTTVTVDLPLMRAIEAVLPYAHQTGQAAAAYPQLPTTLGFLYGAQQYGGYPSARALKKLRKDCRDKSKRRTSKCMKELAGRKGAVRFLRKRHRRVGKADGKDQRRYDQKRKPDEDNLRREYYGTHDDFLQGLVKPATGTTTAQVAERHPAMAPSRVLGLVLNHVDEVIRADPECATQSDFMYAWTPTVSGPPVDSSGGQIWPLFDHGSHEGEKGLRNFLLGRPDGVPQAWRVSALGPDSDDGDKCVCDLLEKLEADTQIKPKLNLFDIERLAHCRLVLPTPSP